MNYLQAQFKKLFKSEPLLCIICSEPISAYGKSCSCNYCSRCLFNWFQANEYKDEEFLTCPNETCNYKFSSQALEEVFRYDPAYQQLMLKRYLRKTKDVSQCPRCEYFGIIPDRSCQDDLVCDKCTTSWKDPQLSPSTKYHLAITWEEFKSALYKNLFTKECPSCSIKISKNGGCSHMTCGKCKYQFCWACLQKFTSHQSYKCGLNQFYFAAIMIFTTLNLAESFSLVSFPINLLVALINLMHDSWLFWIARKLILAWLCNLYFFGFLCWLMAIGGSLYWSCSILVEMNLAKFRKDKKPKSKPLIQIPLQFKLAVGSFVIFFGFFILLLLYWIIMIYAEISFEDLFKLIISEFLILISVAFIMCLLGKLK